MIVVPSFGNPVGIWEHEHRTQFDAMYKERKHFPHYTHSHKHASKSNSAPTR